jgi:hypothetical protein
MLLLLLLLLLIMRADVVVHVHQQLLIARWSGTAAREISRCRLQTISMPVENAALSIVAAALTSIGLLRWENPSL